MQKPEKISKKHLINLLVILAISVTCTFFFSGFEGGIRNILLNITYGIIIGTSIAAGSHITTTVLFSNDRWQERPTRFFVTIVSIVSLVILIDVTIVNFLWFYFTQGVGFIELFSHPYGPFTIIVEFVIGLIIYLIILSKNFADHLNTYYQKVSDIEKQLAQYRYDTLKNQLNPHFLFNTLNTLSGLIYQDVDKADKFILRLSNIYRYILDIQTVEVVTIETELALINDFLYLNNIRFDGQIVSNVDIEDKEQYVVPMAIQLLYENAIKHNVVSSESQLTIEVFVKDDYLHVRNNLQRKAHKEPSHQLGIKNLKERYQTLTDRPIEITETATQFTVSIPILLKAD